MKKKRSSGISYFLLEIFSIFLGVTIAFLANHLNEVRKDKIAEQKILAELKVELASDLTDIEDNIGGHKLGVKVVDLFRRYCNGREVDYDSLGIFYEHLYKDYLSISNTTAYETLKSKGLDIVTNEKLRNEIVRLYDFEYEVLEKVEEQYQPAQFHQNYFTILTRHFKNHMELKNGRVVFLKPYGKKPDTEIMMIFKEISYWRSVLLISYEQTVQSIASVSSQIEEEIK